MSKFVCPKCDGSGYRPKFWYYEDGICFGCQGKGTVLYSHPALLYFFGERFQQSTKGCQLPGIDRNRSGVTGSITSDPLPPDVARQVFDILTKGNRGGTRVSEAVQSDVDSLVFTHSHKGTTWQIHLLTGIVGDSVTFLQLQLVFSREWETTARALVENYLGLFVAVSRQHPDFQRIQKAGHVLNYEGQTKDDEILGSDSWEDGDGWRSPVLSDDEHTEETINDHTAEGLGIGEVRFQDADSEYR